MTPPSKSSKYATPEEREKKENGSALSDLVRSSSEEETVVKSGAERRAELKESVLEDKDLVLRHDLLDGTVSAQDVLSQQAFIDAKAEKETADISRKRRDKWKSGQAERDDLHIDVEETAAAQAQYGTVEQEMPEDRPAFHTEDRSTFAAAVNPSAADTMREVLKKETATPTISRSESYWNALRERRTEKKTSGRTTFAEVVENAADDFSTISTGGDDLDERSSATAQKYSYHAGKYAVKGGVQLTRKAVHGVGLARRVAVDLKSHTLTKEEVTRRMLRQGGRGIIDLGKGAAEIVRDETASAIADFRGSEDWGIESAVKIKDTYRTVRGSIKTGQRGVRAAKWGVRKVEEAARRVWTFVKSIFSSPVVIKGMAIAGIAAAALAGVFLLITACSSLFLTLSLKSENSDLSQTYLYITELDARMEYDILTEDTKAHFPPIDVYVYYLNGEEVSKDAMSVYTDADLILAYLDSKYDDYSFSGFLAGLFGVTVKDEIDEIHAALHQVETSRWTESTDNGDGTVDHTYYMGIYLTTQSWSDYYEEHKDELLTEEEQEKYDALRGAGIYTFRKELASPFVGVDWSQYVSSRWGWRVHPITGELAKHLGLDIAISGGTPVNACHSGTVTTGYDADGLGNYVRITTQDGNSYTVYGHLRSCAVSNGQTVQAGEVLGYVGTTGASTGDHLHLEYHQNGETLNPLIFTECDAPADSSGAA